MAYGLRGCNGDRRKSYSRKCSTTLLNVGNEQIAYELSVNERDVYQRTAQLRDGMVKKLGRQNQRKKVCLQRREIGH
jgi:hypothetical protein